MTRSEFNSHNETSTLIVSGGFANQKHVENKISIGNMAKYFVKNKTIEWNSFKDIYYKNDKLAPEHYIKFLEVLNNIFILPVYTIDENELLYLIKNIYEAPPNNIINAIVKNINLFHSLKSAIRHLFMVYKMYIERLIEKYVQLRNNFISDNNLDINKKENASDNSEQMLLKWHAIDDKNNIDTSSIILFFNFPPPSVQLEKTIPQITWTIKPPDSKSLKSTTHKKVISAIDEFLKEIKTRKFNYVGFCPFAAVHRFLLLLKFPTKKLLDVIEALDTSGKISSNISYNIIKDIDSLAPKIEKINNAIKPNLKVKKVKVPDIEKFNKKTDSLEKIKCFEKYIDAFLSIYEVLTPHIIKKENLINELSIDINLLANKIQAITDSLYV